MREDLFYAAPELGSLVPGWEAQEDIRGPGVHEGLKLPDALLRGP